MVSIVEDVAVAASLVAAAVAVSTTKPSLQPNDSDNNNNAPRPSLSSSPAAVTAAISTLTRRLDVGLAVSQAFDATLVHLARELRGGIGTTSRLQGLRGSAGRHEGPSLPTASRPRRHHHPHAMTQSQQSAAIARAAGAGLFLDAYEAVVACLLRAFNYLAEGGPEDQEKLGSSPPSFSDDDVDEPLKRGKQPLLGEGRRGGKRSADEGVSFGGQKSGGRFDASDRPTTMSERMVENGIMPRGWDAEVRRNAWTQRKLEVLGMCRYLFPCHFLHPARFNDC